MPHIVNLTKNQFKTNLNFFVSFNPVKTNKSKLSLLYTGVIDITEPKFVYS